MYINDYEEFDSKISYNICFYMIIFWPVKCLR